MHGATICPEYLGPQPSGSGGKGGRVLGMSSESSSGAGRFIATALVLLIVIIEAYIWIKGQSGWD